MANRQEGHHLAEEIVFYGLLMSNGVQRKGLTKKIELCIISITLLKGGDDIGKKGRILLDGFTD
jgi:hypothetical protein